MLLIQNESQKGSSSNRNDKVIVHQNDASGSLNKNK